ncbi:MAG: oligosaccharide flippase family protein [Planctomycetes bacterium]|nr:oligosaccharide flippase family protein [Planctomycetota bacterium]
MAPRRPFARILRTGFRNASFALRPGVLFAIAGRARYPLASSMATQMAVLVSSIVLARVMGERVFGQYGMILTIQVMFFTASNLRLSSILPAFIAPVRDDPTAVRRIASTAIVLTIGLSGVGIMGFLALLRPSVAFCEIPGLEWPTALVCVPVVAALPLQYVVLAEIQSMERIGLWSVASACVGVTPVAFALLGCIWFGSIGLGGYAVFVGTGSLVGLVLLMLLRRRADLPRWGMMLDSAVARKLLAAGLSLWFICILDTVALSLARVFTVRYAGHGEVGCFILAYGFVGYLQMLNGAFTVPLVPKWSRLAKNRQKSRLLRDIRNSSASFLVSGCAYGALLYLLSPYFVPFVYGEEYHSAIRLLRILAWTCPIIGVGFSAWTLFISQGRVRVVFWANVAWASTLTLSSVFLVRWYHAPGAATAVVIAYACWGLVYAVCLAPQLLEIARWKRPKQETR